MPEPTSSENENPFMFSFLIKSEDKIYACCSGHGCINLLWQQWSLCCIVEIKFPVGKYCPQKQYGVFYDGIFAEEEMKHDIGLDEK